MLASQPFARGDTLLGVCQSLGDDFGFNPNIARAVFGASLIWNPIAVLAIYLTLAVVVAASHWMFPAAPKRDEQIPAVPAQVEELVYYAKAA